MRVLDRRCVRRPSRYSRWPQALFVAAAGASCLLASINTAASHEVMRLPARGTTSAVAALRPAVQRPVLALHLGASGRRSRSNEQEGSWAPNALHTSAAASGGGVPEWNALVSEAEKTPTGQKLTQAYAERAKGGGSPHTDSTLRLFGASEKDVRVTLYRDRAGWCPYCQKVWIMLEEKKIPYRVSHINMRSYGPKPDSFLAKVPNGLLPAVELDGKLYTDSIAIMRLLDETFSDYEPAMIPAGQTQRIDALYRLERALFGAWCELMFRPGGGGAFSGPIGMLLGGGGSDGRLQAYETLLDRVDQELGKSWAASQSPFFLGTETPTLIDLQFISHIERMEASVTYWKGVKMRGQGRENLDRWLEAFDARESYRATKSDFYTHVMDIPPQYGYAYADESNPRARDAVDFIGGGSYNYPKDSERPNNRGDMNGVSWTLPIPNYDQDSWEPIRPPYHVPEEEARHEAVYELTRNYEDVVKFACRGTGDEGRPQYSAPLADPFALANPADKDDVDLLFRMAATSLLRGSLPQFDASDIPRERREALARCIRYVRDRVGVPRDMSFPAAQHLRGHLNHLVTILSSTTQESTRTREALG